MLPFLSINAEQQELPTTAKSREEMLEFEFEIVFLVKFLAEASLEIMFRMSQLSFVVETLPEVFSVAILYF